MNRSAYLKYKSANIEWLESIPLHWEVKAVKRVSSFYTGWTPPTGKDEFFEGQNLWANISDLGPRVLNNTTKHISDEAIEISRLRLSPKGSLLFSFKLSIGQVSIAGQDMYTNEAIATFPSDGHTDIIYLYWATPIFIPHNANENIYGAKLLNQDLIKNAKMVLPPLPEQQAIAAFLDHETAHIDTLISKKQHQIELLQEKRTALISHVVTKGLNPNAKVKDSGIEWLGEMPEHWKIIRLKHITSHIVDCLHATPVYSEDGIYPAIRTSDVRPGGMDVTNAKRVNEEEYLLRISRLKPLKEDIVYSREGERFGIAALVPDDQEICLSQRMMMFRCKQGIIAPAFLMWQLNGKGVYIQAGQDVIGATSPHVNVETIRNFWLTLPPYQEQLKILDHIDREVWSIDTLISKIKCSMQKLNEYRTALISAAVTGKIDVRKEVA